MAEEDEEDDDDEDEEDEDDEEEAGPRATHYSTFQRHLLTFLGISWG